MVIGNLNNNPGNANNKKSWMGYSKIVLAGMMDLNKANKNRIKNWTITAVAFVLIGLLFVWTILTRQANQDKSYSGAKFVEYQAGGLADG